ncbi:MAG: hypothetical protein KDC98_04400, partial [Planctomycetes bacterium]|nr:hypothetical protein [Planctomycetota bacterium]
VFTAERAVRVLLGLFKVYRQPVCAIDAEGIVRYVTADAHCEVSPAREVEGRLHDLLERFSTWGDAGLVVPEVQLVKPGQVVDLGGLVEKAQLEALAAAEIGALGAGERVVLVVRRRQ